MHPTWVNKYTQKTRNEPKPSRVTVLPRQWEKMHRLCFCCFIIKAFWFARFEDRQWYGKGDRRSCATELAGGLQLQKADILIFLKPSQISKKSEHQTHALITGNNNNRPTIAVHSRNLRDISRKSFAVWWHLVPHVVQKTRPSFTSGWYSDARRDVARREVWQTLCSGIVHEAAFVIPNVTYFVRIRRHRRSKAAISIF